jgi:BirA family biotin operon repressor/biotin-[acetyl-CoA-carboxylase] ligase
LPTSPEPFRVLRLDRCRSTSDYVKENLARLEKDLPLMVSADAQTAGRGRDGRRWSSAPGLGLCVTFAFRLADARRLSLLAIVSGVAVADALAAWTGREFALKWPNDVLAGGKKVAGILCESTVKGDETTCLAGIGVNVNQQEGDFPEDLRGRAGSLRLLTGREWPLAEGRERLAAGMASWLRRLADGRRDEILDRARVLMRDGIGRELSFHHRGKVWRGVCRGLAADGGLLLQEADGGMRTFYSGEIDAGDRPA